MLKHSLLAILPTLIPIISVYLSKHASQRFHALRDSWDHEYDYIIGKFSLNANIFTFY